MVAPRNTVLSQARVADKTVIVGKIVDEPPPTENSNHWP